MDRAEQWPSSTLYLGACHGSEGLKNLINLAGALIRSFAELIPDPSKLMHPSLYYLITKLIKYINCDVVITCLEISQPFLLSILTTTAVILLATSILWLKRNPAERCATVKSFHKTLCSSPRCLPVYLLMV